MRAVEGLRQSGRGMSSGTNGTKDTVTTTDSIRLLPYVRRLQLEIQVGIDPESWLPYTSKALQQQIHR